MKKILVVMTSMAFSVAASSALAGVGEKFDAKTLAQAEEAVNESWTKASAEDRKRLIQDYSNQFCTAYKDKPTPDLAKS